MPRNFKGTLLKLCRGAGEGVKPGQGEEHRFHHRGIISTVAVAYPLIVAISHSLIYADFLFRLVYVQSYVYIQLTSRSRVPAL